MDILVVDDHALVRDGLSQVLAALADAVVVHQAATVGEALALVKEGSRFQLILVDLALPDGDGLEVVAAFAGGEPRVPVVVLSGSDEAASSARALAAGAQGFIPKSSPTAILVQALRLVLAGGVYAPPPSSPHPPARTHGYGDGQGALTPRQQGILAQLASGQANKSIAQDLGISEATVKAHVSAIFRVLGVSNRTQAVRAAQSLGLIE
ncbi:MAG: response regulator transcription factor [Gammaproteobacteria bacterium]